MDKEKLYSIIKARGKSDYEVYLNTNQLLSCQKDFKDLCNQDELQFQIVHQVEEMLLKLMAYTLIELAVYIEERKTFRVLTYFRRVHIIQHQLIDMMNLLETMSPADYQSIRTLLGNGSGITSPGFKTLKTIMPTIWDVYKENYLVKSNLTVEQIYWTEYLHNDAYAVAEALVEMDALYHRFFKRHLDLIARTIGTNSHSLRGRPVQALKAHSEQHLFPELWVVRDRMTDAWGQEYGTVRPAIGDD